MISYRGTLRFFNNIPLTVMPSGLGSTIAERKHRRSIVGRSFTTFTRRCSVTMCPAHIERPGSGTLMRGTIGLVCEAICGSVRNLMFRSLGALGSTVLISLSGCGTVEVTNHSCSEIRRFSGDRGSCLHPLPSALFYVGRHGDIAIRGGNCVALVGRRCDIPIRCVKGHIRMICSSGTLRVCRGVHLVAARLHSSAPFRCARGSARKLPKERNDCRGSLRSVCRHTKRVSGVLLSCLGRMRHRGGCPPLTFVTYHNVVSLRGGCKRKHLMTTYTYTRRGQTCKCNRLGGVLRGNSSTSFVPNVRSGNNASRILVPQIIGRRGVHNGRCFDGGRGRSAGRWGGRL